MGDTKPRGPRSTGASTTAVTLVVLTLAFGTLVGLTSVGAVPAGATSGQAHSSPHSSAVATGVRSAADRTWWVPPLGSQPWQWELSSPLNLKNAKQLGTKDKLPNGSPASAPVIYDIDGISNPASTVSALHALGKHVVCYIEVGAVGNYYSATDEGIATTYYDQLNAAGVIGSSVSGWPEWYLDIRSPATVAIIESMIHDQCAAKGFDAVETDIDESYHSANGFGLTQADEEHFMTTLAGYMHGLQLGWWIKNPDDTGDHYASDMEPLADAVLTEQCNQYLSCGLLSSYFGVKAIFNAEYQWRPAKFCTADTALGINGAQFNLNLTGTRKPCA
jgi:hypothetical protein